MIRIAKDFIEYIESLGYEAYIVGGCVRDIILKLEPHDVDIVTNCPLKLLKKFEDADISKNKKNFDVIIVKYHDVKFEVASFRGETIQEDLDSRDFLINSIAMDKNGHFIGRPEAFEDFDNRKVTCFNPDKILDEDAIRIIRGIRIASAIDFEIDSHTFKIMKVYAYKIAHYDGHRVYEEFIKGLSLNSSYKVQNFIEFFNELKILSKIDPITAFETSNCESKNVDKAILCFCSLFYKIDFNNIFKISNEVSNIMNFMRKCDKVNFIKINDYEVANYIVNRYWKYYYYYNLCTNSNKWKCYNDRINQIIDKLDKIPFNPITGDMVMNILHLSTGKLVGDIIKLSNELIFVNNITDEDKFEDVIKEANYFLN